MATPVETLFKLKSPTYKSIAIPSVATPGLTAGDWVAVGATYGVAVQTYAPGDRGVVCYAAEKYLAQKVAGSGKTIAAGDPVYWDTATGKLVSLANSSTADHKVGRCLKAALAADTEVLIEIDQNV